MRLIKTATVAATLALLGAGVTTSLAQADPPTPAPPAPPAGPKTSIDSDGIYKVGTDIVPGTYASAGPSGEGVCYWRRADATDTTLDNAMTKKPQVVAITPDDVVFKTNGCQAWQLTDQAPPNDLPPMLNGLKMQGYLAMINGMAGLAPVPPPEQSTTSAPDAPHTAPADGTAPLPGPATPASPEG